MQIRPFEEYSRAYPNIAIVRNNGILELTLHTEGGGLMWTGTVHGQLTNLFAEVALDNDNKVIILAGAGDHFIRGMKADTTQKVWGLSKVDDSDRIRHKADASTWSYLHYVGKRLMQAHLDIEAPMIAAVNGPITTHSEQALLCDIVLASETASFQDTVHFAAGLVPGNGVHVIYSEAMGVNRARYFQLTGQSINAQQAFEWGLVNEVLPADQLMNRARELAAQILEQPPMVVRLSRQVFVQDLKKRMLDEVGYGLALESFAATEYFPPEGIAVYGARRALDVARGNSRHTIGGDPLQAMKDAAAGAFPDGLTLEIRSVIGEGDNVVLEYRAHGTTANGRYYDNEYCIVFTLRNNKILEMREFTDTHRIVKTMLD